MSSEPVGHWMDKTRGSVLLLLVFALLVGGVISGYRVLEANDKALVSELVQQRAAKFEQLMVSMISGRLSILQRMAWRWDAADGTPEELWRKDADSSLAQLKGLRAMSWVDAGGRLRWAEPQAATAQMQSLDERVLPHRDDPDPATAAKSAPVASQPLALDRAWGYEAYAPIVRHGRFDGYLTAVFSIDELFAPVVAQQINDFKVIIVADGTTLFESQVEGGVNWTLAQRTTLQVSNAQWVVTLVPGRRLTDHYHTSLPATILVAGLIGAALLCLLIRAVLVARHRANGLLQANHLNSAILTSAANLVIATDRKGLVVIFNKAAEMALGYTAAEIIGKHTPALWHDPEEIRQRAVKMSAELGVVVEPTLDVFLPRKCGGIAEDSSECTFIRKDGSRFLVKMTVTGFRSAGSEETGYLGVSEDISARRAAQREREAAEEQLRISEERHRLLINGVAEYAIYWLDEKGLVCSWNAGARNLKQYTEQEIIGKHFSVFFTPEDRAQCMPEAALLTAATKGRYTAEGWRVKKDGTRFWASVLIEPIRRSDGSIAGFAKVSHDESARRDAGRKLADTVRELNAVLGTMVDGLIIIDESRIIRTFTPMAERIFGYRESEVIGRSVDMLMPQPFDGGRDPYAENYFTTRDNKVIGIGREVIARRKNGTMFPMELGISGYEIGGARRFVGVVRDISERKHAEEALKTSEETFRSAMESASVGMALVKPDGRFIKVNAALCALLGFDEQDLLANDFQAITHPEDLTRDLELLQQTLAGKIHHYRMDKRYFHRSGRVIWTRLSVALVRDGAGVPNYFIAQVEDISEQKEIDRIKGEFISIVSHELRTPLTSIRGSLGLIQGAFNEAVPPKVARLIDIAHANCERLILLINDILDIDKIASGKMRFDMQRRSLLQITQKAMQATEAYAQKFEVTVELEPIHEQIEILVDEDRFVQVLANLISNAAKFSPRHGRVTLRAQLRGGRVRLCVVDHGPGIADEFRGRIFHRFSQADSSGGRRVGGSGLGLHIAKQIVERMDGAIGFDSIVGQGSTFWIEFARAAEPECVAPLALLTEECASSRPAILHVEDDVDLTRMLSEALQGRAELVSAPDLVSAEAWLRRKRFALILLDVRLPDGSGLDLLDRLDRLTGLPLPVVILCADTPPEQVDAKVAAVLVKTRVSEAKIIDTVLAALDAPAEIPSWARAG